MRKAKTAVYDAKNIDAGVVAGFHEDSSAATASTDDEPSKTAIDSEHTKELSIDMIWQAQHATELFQTTLR